MSFSVLIIVKNRQDHLLHVLEGIAHSKQQPNEIIIEHMNEPPRALDFTLPIKQFMLSSQHALPLAAARNAAAIHASSDTLIFLDVDCIPTPDCFDTLLTDLETSQLVMANPLYLLNPVNDIDFIGLTADAQPNPARRNLPFGVSTDASSFWSLGFAISKRDYETIGGFDESYVGYGGEDTDFAFRAREAGLSLYYSQAPVYHQNHPSYNPPLNWLADIVTNAQHFKRVWGVWPMEGWLHAFAAAGYISWTPDTIQIIKLPTDQQVAAARRSGRF